LALRHSEIVPRLEHTRSLGAHAVGDKAVLASWRMGDGSVLTIACNFGVNAVCIAAPDGKLMFSTGGYSAGSLAGRTTCAWLHRDSTNDE
jgi:maltooligosyltrehalose trehalohydrolase